jgi:uncharacterized protein (TIGR02246 family)
VRRLALLVLLAATFIAGVAAQAADTAVTGASARAFVARQDAAWNGRDATAFAATFTPDAVFIDQAVGSDGKLIPNGRSTLAEATAQARRFFAKSRFRQITVVGSVTPAADGRSAQVLAKTTTRIERPGQPPRTFCALSEQTLVLVHGRLLSRGQTDTDVRCAK